MKKFNKNRLLNRKYNPVKHRRFVIKHLGYYDKMSRINPEDKYPD